MATDAFGRYRVSNPETLFDYYPSTQTSSSTLDEDIWITSTINTGTASYSSSGNYVELKCTGNSSSVTRETKVPMIYQPGKSRLIYMTGVMLDRAVTGSESVTSRMGLFNPDSTIPVEGVYFETDGINMSWVESYASTPTAVNKADWNIDPLDGTGPSGITWTISRMTKNILIVIDQEWLGVGRVRVGFEINGVIYYVHQFTHDHIAVPYTTTPRLPLCYQIVTTTVSSAISQRQICCSSMSEGGYTPTGKRNSFGTSSTVTLSSASTKYIVLAFKIKSANPTGMLKPWLLNILYLGGAGTQYIKYELQLHSTIGTVGVVSANPTYADLKDSVVSAAVGSGQTISTDGYILTQGFLTEQGSVNFSQTEFESLLTRMSVTQYDTLYVVISASGTSSTVYASLDFIESS